MVVMKVDNSDGMNHPKIYRECIYCKELIGPFYSVSQAQAPKSRSCDACTEEILQKIRDAVHHRGVPR